MRATAILPVKRFGDAKQRLLAALDRPQRAGLVKAMLADVLTATTEVQGVERVIVVTSEGRAERIALRHGQRVNTQVEVLEEPVDRGHPEAATLGIVRAKALGAECVALLPGDCPLLDADELDAALERMHPGRVSVVPDRHGTGTNALLMAPASARSPCGVDVACALMCTMSPGTRSASRSAISIARVAPIPAGSGWAMSWESAVMPAPAASA